ncbi:hypothetical protein V8D89_013032 [Ganoderma adspersum]
MSADVQPLLSPLETAPLLQNVSHPDGAPADQDEEPSFIDRLAAIVQEPLSPLTKVLLIATLVFLLLSSVFIGLFAGAQHKLNHGEGNGGATVTVTATVTTTSQATTTAASTTTVSFPAPPEPTSPPEEPVCLSASCISLASSVLSALDETEDPCENFYDYANGGWLKSNPIPSDKGKFGHFEEIALQNKRLLQQILSEDSSSHFSEASSLMASNPYDEQLLKKLRGLYQSCLDEDYLNEVGEAPLKELTQKIREVFRGKTTVVDILKSKSEQERDRLTAAVAYLHSRGIDGLFSYTIDGDVGNDPNLMTLWISQPDLGLPSKEYYEEESIVDLYQNTLKRLLVTLDNEEDTILEEQVIGEPSDLVVHEQRLKVWPPWPWPPWGDDDDGNSPENRTERAQRLAKEVIKFEKRIANASLDLDILYQDPIGTYNPVPFKNVSDSLPEFDFSTYFSTFAPRSFPNTIILTSTTYLSDLSHILNDTSKDVLEAYFVTRAGLAYASYLGLETEAWQAVRSLEEVLNGIKKGAVGDRAEYCVGRVESALGFALGRYFVRETFGGESRRVATKVITDIIGAFKKSLKKLEWMDKESGAAAAGKADALRVKVGYPLSPNTEDPRSLANWYYRVTIKNDTFFENMLSAEVADQIRTWFRVGKQRDPQSWEMYASTVNAYFNPPANEIVFPAGILRPPFFRGDWPGYMNYGSFGQVAAHELTHAFDSAGRLYNQNGKLEEWWTNSTSEGFNVRQKCIVDQYSNYTVDDGKGSKIYVNGNLTSGENIGDSGLIQAFRAWKAQYDDKTEFLLPGLNYTREQLFFISFARSWAQNIKPEAAVARVRTDPHSPNRYRVHGTVSNIPEFAAAFKCSPHAKLNPPQEKRCVFW